MASYVQGSRGALRAPIRTSMSEIVLGRPVPISALESIRYSPRPVARSARYVARASYFLFQLFGPTCPISISDVHV
jgi:hypothetical protein